MPVRWSTWTQRAARVRPRDDIEVSPSSGRTRFQRGSEILRNVYNSYHLAMKTEIPRVDIAPHGVETPTLLDALIGWGSWSQCSARVAPRGIVEITPLTGRLMSHPRMRNPFKSLLRQPGDEKVDLPHQYHPYGVETPILLADCSLAGAHGVSAWRRLPLGTTSSIAAPGEVRV